MSDPVTNVEIEDVLSSIRKLVAEEVRATPVARRPEKLGRLILTAAQRVKDDNTETTKSSGPVLLTQPIVPGASPNGERSIDEIPGDARLADFGEVEGAFPDIDSFDESEPQSDSSNGDTPENWTVDLAEDDHTSGDASDAQANDHPDEGGQDDSRSELNRLIEEEVSAALGMSDEDETEDEDHDTIREDHEGWAEVEPDTDWHESKEDHFDCEDELKDATDNDQSAQAETAEDLASDDAAAEAAPQMQDDSDRHGDDDTKVLAEIFPSLPRRLGRRAFASGVHEIDGAHVDLAAWRMRWDLETATKECQECLSLQFLLPHASRRHDTSQVQMH